MNKNFVTLLAIGGMAILLAIVILKIVVISLFLFGDFNAIGYVLLVGIVSITGLTMWFFTKFKISYSGLTSHEKKKVNAVPKKIARHFLKKIKERKDGWGEILRVALD